MAATEDDVPALLYGIALLSRYPARLAGAAAPPDPTAVPHVVPGPRKIILVNEEPRAVVIGDLETGRSARRSQRTSPSSPAGDGCRSAVSLVILLPYRVRSC